MIEKIINKIGVQAVSLGLVAPVSEEVFGKQVKIILNSDSNLNETMKLLENITFN